MSLLFAGLILNSESKSNIRIIFVITKPQIQTIVGDLTSQKL